MASLFYCYAVNRDRKPIQEKTLNASEQRPEVLNKFALCDSVCSIPEILFWTQEHFINPRIYPLFELFVLVLLVANKLIFCWRQKCSPWTAKFSLKEEVRARWISLASVFLFIMSRLHVVLLKFLPRKWIVIY